MSRNCTSRRPRSMDEMGRRVDEVIDAVGVAHHTDVADQVTSSLAQRRVRRAPVVDADFRRRAHDEDVLAAPSAALERDCADRLVGGDHDVGAAVGQPLGGAHQPVEEAAPAELRLEHLRPHVVHVVDDPHAEQQLERQRHEEQQIRRVAEVDDGRPVPEPHLPGQPVSPSSADAYSPRNPTSAASLLADPVAVDVDAVEIFVGRRCSRASAGRSRSPRSRRRARRTLPARRAGRAARAGSRR